MIIDRRASQMTDEELAAKYERRVAEVVEKLPPGWDFEMKGEDGYYYRNDKRGLSLIVSEAREGDGRLWRHASIAHRKRIPNYEELCFLKRYAFGPNVEAYQVFPRAEKHINIHPNCLHLWACMEESALPDFTRGGDSI